MEEERSRVAQDLHDELGAGLTEVSILGSLAKNPAVSPEKKDLYLDQLTNAARALITELDEIVWAVNPHYDSVGSLASYYSLFGQRFLNLAGIPCRLHIAEQFPDHPLDSKVRHGIFLAFKEALNNIVRHSGATEVELKIEVARERLVIVVSDNGCGLLSMTSAPGHDGLASMQQRLRKLGGSCSIRSEPGCGTTVEFQLPLLPPLPQESARPIAPEMRPLP
jgi:signal transduction histidine kinase